MNLLGFEITLAKNNKNGKYVKQDECHRAQDAIGKRVDEVKEHINQRIDDLKDFIRKNGFNRG